MCNCMTEIEDEMIKQGFTEATIHGTAFIFIDGQMKLRTVQDCTYKDGVTKAGRDRIKHLPVKHSYCPFCGKNTINLHSYSRHMYREYDKNKEV